MRPFDQNLGTRPLRPSDSLLWIAMIFWQQFRGSWYNLGHYSHQIPLNAFLRAAETPSPNFMMNLFQYLYDVDAHQALGA